MSVVIGDFEVVEPAPPPTGQKSEDQLPANDAPTAREIELLVRHQLERCERVRAH